MSGYYELGSTYGENEGFVWDEAVWDEAGWDPWIVAEDKDIGAVELDGWFVG